MMHAVTPQFPNTEDNAKVPEVGALLPGKTENFQDRSPQWGQILKLFKQHHNQQLYAEAK